MNRSSGQVCLGSQGNQDGKGGKGNESGLLVIWSGLLKFTLVWFGLET